MQPLSPPAAAATLHSTALSHPAPAVPETCFAHEPTGAFPGAHDLAHGHPARPPQPEQVSRSAGAAAAPEGPAHRPAPLPASIFRLKRCRTCGEEKPPDRFYRQRGCAETHRPDCKACTGAYGERWRARGRKTEPGEGERRCRQCAQLWPLEEFQPADGSPTPKRRHICRTCQAQRAAKAQEPLTGLNRPDACLKRNSRLRGRRIDLGLAILRATSAPGECHTLEEIAAYAGVSVEQVRQIEQRALEKMHAHARRLLAEVGLAEVVKVAL